MTDRHAIGQALATTKALGPTQNNAAALRGASLAFGKKSPQKPHAETNTYSGNNGALAAATSAGRISRSNSVTNALSAQGTGNQIAGRLTAQSTGQSDVYSPSTMGHSELGLVKKRVNQLGRSDTNSLQPLAGNNWAADEQARSPSHIAATLAASRAIPSSPGVMKRSPGSPAFSPGERRRSHESSRPDIRRRSRTVGAEDEVDSTSNPATNSLIGMFEQSIATAESLEPKKKKRTAAPAPIMIATAAPPMIHSPKPVRTLPIRPLQTSTSPKRELSARPIPIPRGKSHAKLGRLDGDGRDDDNSDNDSFVSASDQMSISTKSTPALPPPRRMRPSSKPRDGPSRSERDAIAIDAMANAIVASSLASSRAASPAKRRSLDEGRPIPPSRRTTPHSLFHIHHHDDNKGRTPSPLKGMRQTLRKPPKSDGEDDATIDKARRKNPLKKHPNKHHEGERKRWRDTVTERERKRYEAVWASNKGLYTVSEGSFPPPPTSQALTYFPDSSTTSLSRQPEMVDVVLNIVVRDVWSRSRLGSEILEEVWDLVDRIGKGYLGKEEFVVGMWLIDQRLKGRKLPVKVGESVWGSVGLGGLKVRNRKDAKKRRDH